MSQAKVDKYKKEKANRKQIMKREKRMLFLEKMLGVLVCVALVAWVGFSVYQKQTASDDTTTAEVEYTDVNITAISDFNTYINSLSE